MLLDEFYIDGAADQWAESRPLARFAGNVQAFVCQIADAGREPEPEPRREVRLSEVRQPPPVLHEGSRGGRPQAPKEKGWNEIPAADRTQMTQFVKKAMRKGLTEAEATGRLARTYWEVKG